MQLYDVKATAARLSLHPETIRKELRAGNLRGVRTGRTWKVEESEIAAYIERLKAKQN